MDIKRGDVFRADLAPTIGSEQGGLRPVLVVQNDVGNRFSNTIIVAPITSRQTKKQIPTHVPLSSLTKDSLVLAEQLRTLDKQRLGKWMCAISPSEMADVDNALLISLGLQTA